MPKVPLNFSRAQMIAGVTGTHGRILFLHMTARAKTEFLECFFNFEDMTAAKKLIDTNYIIVEGMYMPVERLDRPYYFMEGSRVVY